jgi:hypothetical protein
VSFMVPCESAAVCIRRSVRVGGVVSSRKESSRRSKGGEKEIGCRRKGPEKKKRDARYWFKVEVGKETGRPEDVRSLS